MYKIVPLPGYNYIPKDIKYADTEMIADKVEWKKKTFCLNEKEEEEIRNLRRDRNIKTV